MNRLRVSVAATAIAVTAIGLAAPGAGAVHTRNVYVCNSSGMAGLGAQSISANPGDTIRIFNNCNSTGGTGVFRYPATDLSVWEAPNLNWQVLSSVSAVVNKVGSSTQEFGQVGVGTNLMTLTVNAVSEPVPGPPPFEPHDCLQQVGLPESGSCGDIPPESGHWHGAPFGGWSQSWAQWPNDGNSGPVRTRMTETTESGALILVG